MTLSQFWTCSIKENIPEQAFVGKYVKNFLGKYFDGLSQESTSGSPYINTTYICDKSKKSFGIY